jgi:hypothetical protein
MTDLLDCEKEGGIRVIPEDLPNCDTCGKDMELISRLFTRQKVVYECFNDTCPMRMTMHVPLEDAKEQGWKIKI